MGCNYELVDGVFLVCKIPSLNLKTTVQVESLKQHH